MWEELAATVLGKAIGGGGKGPTSVVSGAPNFIDASFDSSQWTVATGSASARADNSKVDVPIAASAWLAAQSAAPYVDSGGLVTAGFGGIDMQSLLPVVLLAAGLAIVWRKV